MIAVIQTILGVLLILAGGFIAAINWAVIVQWVAKRRHSSWIPLAGGGLFGMGMALVPYSPANELWWVPLLADWGCIPGFVFTAIHSAWSRLKPEDEQN